MFRRKKIRCRRNRPHFWFLIPVVLLIGAFILFESQLTPLVAKAAASQAKQMFTTAVNEAVAAELQAQAVQYSDLIHIEKAGDGAVLAITTDSIKMNQLKADVSLAVQNKLMELKERSFSVHLGTLTGLNILRDRGPSIPLSVSFSGSVVTDFTSSFESAGINQTKHQISLTVKGSEVLMAPGMNQDTNVETSVAVAETVIVGEVPEFMADLSGIKQ